MIAETTDPRQMKKNLIQGLKLKTFGVPKPERATEESAALFASDINELADCLDLDPQNEVAFQMKQDAKKCHTEMRTCLDNTDLQRRVTAGELVLDNLRDNVRNHNGILRRLDYKVDTLMEDVVILKTDVAVLKIDVAVLKHDVAVLKTDVAVLKTDVAVLKKDVAVIQVQLAGIQGSMVEILRRLPPYPHTQ